MYLGFNVTFSLCLETKFGGKNARLENSLFGQLFKLFCFLENSFVSLLRETPAETLGHGDPLE